MDYELGIDVGTSYTAAALRRADGSIEVVGLGPIADNIPTIVYLTEAGTLIAGDAAARRVAIDPTGAAREFKRRMGDPTPIILRTSPFSAESLLRHMVERVVQQVTDREGDVPAATVVTHPANWGPYKLDLFDQALRVADIGPRTSRLSEPEAAATAYAAQARVPVGAAIAIYDLGGGTFDAAVLRKEAHGFSVLGDSVGIEHLGGADFDEAILHHVRSSLGARWPNDPDDPALPSPMAHLRRACTEAKELLSSETTVSIPVLLPGVDTTVTLERARFEEMIAPRVDDTVAALESAISSARLSVRDLDHVVLVGGSSRIPLIKRKLTERFGPLVATDVDPLFAVAIGAAITAGDRYDAAVDRAPARREAPASAPQSQPQPQPQPQTDLATPDHEFLPAMPAPRPRSVRRALVPAAAVVVAAGVGIGAVLASRGDDGGTASGSVGPTPTDARPVADSAAPVASGADTDPAFSMVAIPAGAYGLGSATSPVARDVDRFFIDTYEVTNAAYESFRQFYGNIPLPADWEPAYPAARAGQPVTSVPYYLAEAYCASVGKRLPTSEEWEVAATWGDPEGLMLAYSWHDSRDSARAPEKVYERTDTIDLTKGIASADELYDVFTNDFDNVSPFGVHDMSGNAAEWVQAPDSPSGRNDVAAGMRHLKGGPSGYIFENSTTVPVIDSPQPSSLLFAGFRCASAAEVTVDGAQPFTEVDIADPPPAPAAEERLPPGEVRDDFQDMRYGLTRQSIETERWGYHPPGYFHLETKAANNEVFTVYPTTLLPDTAYEFEVDAFIDPNKTTGDPAMAFGVGFALDDSISGYVSMIEPTSKRWLLLRRLDETRYEQIDSSPIELATTGTYHLGVSMSADGNFVFRVMDTYVGRPEGYDLDVAGLKFGMFLRSFDGAERSHVHFDKFYATPQD